MREGEKKQVTHTLVPRERERDLLGAEKVTWNGSHLAKNLALFFSVLVSLFLIFWSSSFTTCVLVQTTFTSDIWGRQQKKNKKKGKGPSQQSSTLLRFREMPSVCVCVGSGKKISNKTKPKNVPFFFRERWIFMHTLSWRPFLLDYHYERARPYFRPVFSIWFASRKPMCVAQQNDQSATAAERTVEFDSIAPKDEDKNHMIIFLFFLG